MTVRGSRLPALAACNGQTKERRCRLLRSRCFSDGARGHQVLENTKDRASIYRLEMMILPAARSKLPNSNYHMTCQIIATPIDVLRCTCRDGHGAEGRPVQSRWCVCKRCCLAQPVMHWTCTVLPRLRSASGVVLLLQSQSSKCCHDAAEQSSLERTGLYCMPCT